MGIIFFNKPSGITSFDALRDIKKQLKTGRVGHTGTLDKFANGLLIVLTEKDLKLSRWFTHLDKWYIGKIHFGIETDTLDPEGKIIAEAPVPSKSEVENVLAKFTGEIMQAPPAYSAIHINGERASNLAREGKTPEMKKRPVTIYKLELTDWNPPKAEISVHCSSGTYIRSLARDIALAANSRAHLTELLRTKVGKFELQLAMSNEQLAMNSEQLTVNSEQVAISNEQLTVSSVDKVVIEKLGIPMLDISIDDGQYIKHGKPLNLLRVLCEPLCSLRLNSSSLALFSNDELTAIIEKINNKWKYGCVF